MEGDDSHFFRADENSQRGPSFPESGPSFPGAGTSYPESGTSLQSVVSRHVTHVTRAAIVKEDREGTSYCLA